MIRCERHGDVHLVTMHRDENRLDLPFVTRLHAVLDEVEVASGGPCGLVVTGEGKFFSNGLDIAGLREGPAADFERFGVEAVRLFGRLLVLGVPTVAAVNGHAFAGGAVLALACDHRTMREDRGWICLSEVDAKVPIGPAVMALVRAKLPPATLRDAVLTGKRFAADDALAAGFVDAKAPASDVVPRAVALAGELAKKDRSTFSRLKAALWGDVARGLGVETTAAQG